MSKKDEALKLALEALEFYDQQGIGRIPGDKAITAIREALAEQPAQQQEPSVHAISGRTADELWLETGRLRSELADLKAQQQEPVAWIEGDEPILTWFKTDPEAIPLYTSPPNVPTARASKPWVGLTNEEWRDIVDDPKLDNIGAIKNAIEAKLRENNEHREKNT